MFWMVYTHCAQGTGRFQDHAFRHGQPEALSSHSGSARSKPSASWYVVVMIQSCHMLIKRLDCWRRAHWSPGRGLWLDG